MTEHNGRGGWANVTEPSPYPSAEDLENRGEFNAVTTGVTNFLDVTRPLLFTSLAFTTLSMCILVHALRIRFAPRKNKNVDDHVFLLYMAAILTAVPGLSYGAMWATASWTDRSFFTYRFADWLFTAPLMLFMLAYDANCQAYALQLLGVVFAGLAAACPLLNHLSGFDFFDSYFLWLGIAFTLPLFHLMWTQLPENRLEASKKGKDRRLTLLAFLLTGAMIAFLISGCMLEGASTLVAEVMILVIVDLITKGVFALSYVVVAPEEVALGEEGGVLI
uniref:Uncharacterized protein n=1 Tax=Chromera velia CCMP2878 TaxID=1169474 RepID=A0A0G4FML8_9ALVE|eukprot:Cvel_17823.t1-p1 / transcript=Cvel_17823.t1 / gene=Cvel_17823 / organism=Chromera_velia_CCMP2878 / gene_product=hypothetical protein / transcript_product=hypothetical protein / location=Cvel_scaffold1444:22456-24993(+) / protein_length=276 / sequence_SO=supercontig / SO=protein_coding / is_pseudo=false